MARRPTTFAVRGVVRGAVRGWLKQGKKASFGDQNGHHVRGMGTTNVVPFLQCKMMHFGGQKGHHDRG